MASILPYSAAWGNQKPRHILKGKGHRTTSDGEEYFGHIRRACGMGDTVAVIAKDSLPYGFGCRSSWSEDLKPLIGLSQGPCLWTGWGVLCPNQIY